MGVDFENNVFLPHFHPFYKAEHKRTRKAFAVKMIEKAEVSRLKRRHQNVYNEIFMEKRALTKLAHPNIIRMHSTFQDFGKQFSEILLAE